MKTQAECRHNLEAAEEEWMLLSEEYETVENTLKEAGV
jgi:hypothetical protein